METSLRMQDLAGSKAHAEAGGRDPTAGGTPRLGALERGLPENQWPGPGAEFRRARDPEVSAGPAVPAGTQGRVGSLPKVLPVLVVARCGAAVAGC